MLLDSGLRRNDGGKFTGVFVWFTLRTAPCAFKAQALKSSLRRNDGGSFNGAVVSFTLRASLLGVQSASALVRPSP
jgi:hypothetical protein